MASASGNNMGRDSPGALLDMLAEVASQTLHSEKKLDELDAKKTPQRETKKKSQQAVFTVTQLLSMPATQLVKLFSVFSSDELKRQYSYSCALVPGCGQSYTSFASEGRARMSIKSHLAEHLEFLKNNADAYSTFTATAMKYTKQKAAAQTNKKTKASPVKKPVKENLNKENKETKVGKSTTHLRRILASELNFKDLESPTEDEKTVDLKNIYMSEMKRAEQSLDSKVLGDHSYYEHRKDDKNQNQIQNQIEIDMQSSSNIEHIPVDIPTSNENIMLYIVENDSLKKLPDIESSLSYMEDNNLENLTLWKDETTSSIVDNYVPAKPKGKAKFIGTSKEEREMALVLIEKIRKKGNPTGNNLQCRICDPPRTFTAPTTLVSHYRSHAGIKPYECRICKSVFTRRHSLKYHMLIHQNQTRFTCADCGKKFRHPSHFREHRRRHTGESPFGCDDCGQRFKTRNTYKRHLKTRHGKVLTISGELLHLSEEDSKKVRTKSRRKKQDVVKIDSAVIPSTPLTEDNAMQFFNGSNCKIELNNDENMDSTLWLYDENVNGATEEHFNEENYTEKQYQEENYTEENYTEDTYTEDNYTKMLEIPEDDDVNQKTEFHETDDTEDNFVNNEIVIATDEEGTLHFNQYDQNAQEIYEEISCPEYIIPGDEAAVEANVNYEECFGECMENSSEPIVLENQEAEDNVVVVNEEMVTEEQVVTDPMDNIISIPEYVQEEYVLSDNGSQQITNGLPYQIRVCDSAGKTLQILNNSQIAINCIPQSIDFVQNGKQQTILLLRSDGNVNELEYQNSSVEGAKLLQEVAVPAE